MPQKRRNHGRNKGGGGLPVGGSPTHHHRTPTPSPPPSVHGHFPLYYYVATPGTATGMAIGTGDGAKHHGAHPPYQPPQAPAPPYHSEHWTNAFHGASLQQGSAIGGTAMNPLEVAEYGTDIAGVGFVPPPTPPLPPRLLPFPGPASMRQRQQLQPQQQQAWPPNTRPPGSGRGGGGKGSRWRGYPNGDFRDAKGHDWLVDTSNSAATSQLPYGLAAETQCKEGLETLLEAADIDGCGGWPSTTRDPGSCFKHGGTELDRVRQHVRMLEQSKQADRTALDNKIGIIAQQKATIAQKTATNAQLEEELATMKVALNAKDRELAKLQGHAETLRAFSPADLTALTESLMETLLRVQREHQRKFLKQSDEQLCAVCLSERKDVVLRPCNHLTMCARCFDKCNNVCPQCRAQVTGHLKIYL